MIDRADYLYMGEGATYPGHPVTLAYLITQVFPSLDAAMRRTKDGWPAALGSSLIPGAGGSVYRALFYLEELRRDVDPEALFERGAEEWRRTCAEDVVQASAYGQTQADRFRRKLADMAAWAKSEVLA